MQVRVTTKAEKPEKEPPKLYIDWEGMWRSINRELTSFLKSIRVSPWDVLYVVEWIGLIIAIFLTVCGSVYCIVAVCDPEVVLTKADWIALVIVSGIVLINGSLILILKNLKREDGSKVVPMIRRRW